jgi:hypothetical protein
MKLGISYWGFCEPFEASREAKTPDGHRYGRPIMVDNLISRNHEVYALQARREAVPYKGIKYDEGYPDLDILFVEWRWPTYKNSGQNKFEPDLDRQYELLKHYHGKIPVVIWDCDYKVTQIDEMMWPEAIIADPAFDPRQLTRKRQRLMFWTDWKKLFPVNSTSFEYGYVGNNYERPQAFKTYYSNCSEDLRKFGVQTTVHGNWLEVSPERDSPSKLISMNPHVSFAPRLNFYDSMKRLNSFICTTHITKPEYAKRGFASPRYVENIVSNVPGLVPVEFLKPDLLGKNWTVLGPESVINKVKKIYSMSFDDRVSLIREQENNLKASGVFSIDGVVDFLESLT